MEKQFYRHIELETELEEITILLSANNIDFEISTNEVIIDKVIVGSKLLPKYTLKIFSKDFLRANQLIREHKENKEIHIEDYAHLKALTNEELIEIILNPEEWSIESEIVSRKILNSRGISVPEDRILTTKKEKKEKFIEGKAVSTKTQFLYFISILVGFYLGIIFIIAGIGMGYYYAYGTITDNEGDKYYVYNDNARKNGKLILYGGIVCCLIQLYLMFTI